jgi:rsbT co-antagonist protein RsbR
MNQGQGFLPNLILPKLLISYENQILKDWIASQLRDRGSSRGNIREELLNQQSKEFLSAFAAASQAGSTDLRDSSWEKARDVLTEIAEQQAKQGANPTEIATFIFSLKEVIFSVLQKESGNEPETLARELIAASKMLDQLGLFTTTIGLKSREELISRQQAEMLELSTPVVKLWEGILALPLIGTLDSERTQVVMENLLQEIVRTGAGIAILDITGVPTVDTLVAQHLLKTVAAARLMGAECIISGIRPQIASTIVHLGVDLGGISTKATLADAFAIALRKSNMAVVKIAAPRASVP